VDRFQVLGDVALRMADGVVNREAAMIAYAIVVPSMAFIGVLFTALWIAAIVVGRKGEAFRAALLAEAEKSRGAGQS